MAKIEKEFVRLLTLRGKGIIKGQDALDFAKGYYTGEMGKEIMDSFADAYMRREDGRIDVWRNEEGRWEMTPVDNGSGVIKQGRRQRLGDERGFNAPARAMIALYDAMGIFDKEGGFNDKDYIEHTIHVQGNAIKGIDVAKHA